jgi:hypothetical protein
MWLRKADLVAGVAVSAFGFAALLLALNFRWDLASVQQAGWYTAPGIIPVGVSIVLILQGLALSVHAWRTGGRWADGDIDRVRQSLGSEPVRRTGLVALLLVAYVFLMIGRLHFTFASFLFMAAFMWLFRAGVWWKILLIAGAASVSISYVFQGLARIPLP